MSSTDAMVTINRHGEEGHVAELVLDRPSAMNAVSTAMAQAIGAATAALAADPQVRCVVLTSSHPTAFCVGADLKERNTMTDADLVAQRPVARAAYGGVLALPMPAGAAMAGFAFGGGLELAMACTFRVAAPKAKMGLPEIKLGLIPGYGGTQRLPRLVGEARALEMVLTGRTVGAEEALAIGLVNRLAEGDVVEAAKALAAEFTGYGLPALALAREAVTRALDTPLNEGLRIEADLSTLSYRTQDAVEGLCAFVEKRKPSFRDH